MRSHAAGSADPLLLIEIVLVLLLFGLGVALFLVPAATGAPFPEWWVGITLAIIFFTIVMLDAWRRRRGHHQDLRRALRDPAVHEGTPREPGD